MPRLFRALFCVPLGLTLLGTAAPASAEPVPQSDTSAVSEANAIESVNYWTPERMAAAIPADIPATKAGKPAPASRSGEAGTTAPRAAESRPGSRSRAQSQQGILVNATPTVGKAFFHDPSDGGDYQCSASSLNSGSLRLVLTAGHCVHNGPVSCVDPGVGNAWMENWVFVPGYAFGSRPNGTFPARTLRAFNNWINNCDLQYDAAMVTTSTNEFGALLVNAVGGNALAWNFPTEFDATIFGYPSNHDDGEVQWVCQGRTSRAGVFDPRPQLGCNFGEGSSGGPWFREYSDSTLLGTSNGVMSTVDGAGVNTSPYFDDKIKSMFDATAGD